MLKRDFLYACVRALEKLIQFTNNDEDSDRFFLNKQCLSAVMRTSFHLSGRLFAELERGGASKIVRLGLAAKREDGV